MSTNDSSLLVLKKPALSTQHSMQTRGTGLAVTPCDDDGSKRELGSRCNNAGESKPLQAGGSLECQDKRPDKPKTIIECWTER